MEESKQQAPSPKLPAGVVTISTASTITYSLNVHLSSGKQKRTDRQSMKQTRIRVAAHSDGTRCAPGRRQPGRDSVCQDFKRKDEVDEEAHSRISPRGSGRSNQFCG